MREDDVGKQQVMMKKARQMHFTYGGEVYPYELHVGGVKRLNLRVRADGSIRMSVPRWTTQARIDAFLAENAPRMIEAVKQRRATASEAEMTECYRDGGFVTYLGERVTLRVLSASSGQRRRAVCLLDDENMPRVLYVCLKGEAEKGVIESAVLEWKKERLLTLVERYRKTLVEPIFSRVLPRYDRPSVRYIARPNAIRVHTMTSRWGSCNHIKGNLNFNLWLINAPPRCIEYVIIHEFAHFIHPDHSPKFHALLDALMPDWRERRKQLNDTPIPRGE